MKRTLFTIGLVLCTSATYAGLFDTLGQMFNNNPANTQFETSIYAVKNLSSTPESVAHGLGAGVGITAWLTRTIGTELRLQYCDASWTATTLALEARATINLGKNWSLAPYVFTGPTWTLRGFLEDEQSIGVTAGAGGVLNTPLEWLSGFAEYARVTTDPPVSEVNAGLRLRVPGW